MNTNTDKNHELLCALVLGELPPGADRDRIEAALAESPELRAERERIENTIGIVSKAFEGDAKLSSSAAERLLAAAQSGPVSVGNGSASGVEPAAGLYLLEDHRAPSEGWRSRDSLRAAAGFALFLGVAFAGYRATGGGESLTPDGELAVLEQPVRRFNAPAEGGEAVAKVDIAEAASLAGELQGLNDKLSDSSELQWEAGTTITHLEHAKPGDRAGALKSMAPATSPALDPAAPAAKARMKKGKRLQPNAVLPASRSGAPSPEESDYFLGAVTGSSSQDLTPGSASLLFLDEDADELVAFDDGEVSLEAGNVRARQQLSFSTSVVALRKDLLGLELGRELERGTFALSEDAIWSYLGEQPLDFEAKLELAKQLVLQPFTPLPGESPRTLYTRFYGENPFFEAREDALSTFGVDVDDASWLRTRASLRGGSLPDPRSVRVEEFVNAFRPDVPAPTNGETFAVAFEMIPQRFGADPNRMLLRVALRGKEVTPFERKPLQLTFVVDVSGSMDESNRLPLVKDTLALLVDQLGSGDSISIISFSDEARVVQPMVPAANRTQILAAIDSLESEGGTNAEAGLVTGYEVAAAQVAQGVTSRVVLLSDGIANLGETDQARLTDRVAKERESGVFLNTVGVGLEPGGDAFLEQLADRGDGMATWMQDAEGARRSLIENFTGAFETIARDVKIQVEFDPQHTSRWRQIGYENRAIADEDFRNDRVDAGEVGAGHQVVALYEVELARGIQSNRMPQPGENIATVRVRWKSPEGDEVQELERHADVGTVVSWEGASAGMKLSVVAARFAEVLRRSKHARSIELNELAKSAEELSLYEGDPDLIELGELIGLATPLVAALSEPDAELEPLFEALRDNALRKARFQLDHPLPEGESHEDSLQGPRDDDPAWIDLGKERQDLEQRVADVLRKRLKALGDR